MRGMAGRPTEEDATEIAGRFAAEPIDEVHRFPTGLAHYVYDVTARSGARLVVRLGVPESARCFASAAHWSGLLRPIGVPLPAILAAGEHHGLPYMLLERLPGSDLGLVYGDLASHEKRAIAAEIVRIQRAVAGLPAGAGYGFMENPDDRLEARGWEAVVLDLLARCRRYIDQAPVVDREPIERVARQLPGLSRYFASVPPTPFLDDATTKNVIVDGGRLTGIVDVDWICYGDPLFAAGLTRASLLRLGHDAEYVDAWCELLGLEEDQRRAVAFYTALFCADFLSELGLAFNRAAPKPVDRDDVARLVHLIDTHLAMR